MFYIKWLIFLIKKEVKNMFPFEPDYYLILYIQAIIWFILVGFLIYLIFRNKLTYIDEFRQRIVSGIFFFIIIMSCILVFQVSLQIPQEILIMVYLIMFIGYIIFIALTLHGISKLINYVSSIIDFETKNKKKFAIIFSTILTAILSIIYAIPRLNDVILLTGLSFQIISWLIVYFAAIYTLFLHQEMRKIDLNILLYFGLCYLCIASSQLLSLFLDSRTDMLFWVFTLLFFTVLNIFLIIGYLDFKNKVNKGLVK